MCRNLTSEVGTKREREREATEVQREESGRRNHVIVVMAINAREI